MQLDFIVWVWNINGYNDVRIRKFDFVTGTRFIIEPKYVFKMYFLGE